MKSIALILPLLVFAACSENKTPGGTGSPVAAAQPPAGTEWATTVIETPDGGFRMGNPNAPIKLVEYASLTCSHCAEFSEKASGILRDTYVASGKVSYELRNYVRDPMDMTATLLARCAGPGPFFPLTEQMLADQANWFAKIGAVPAAQQQAISTLPPQQQYTRFASIIGVDQFVRQRGISADRINACFANQAEADKLVKMRDRANTEFQLQGTPTFLINGQVVPDTASWEALEPQLKAAGA